MADAPTEVQLIWALANLDLYWFTVEFAFDLMDPNIWYYYDYPLPTTDEVIHILQKDGNWACTRTVLDVPRWPGWKIVQYDRCESDKGWLFELINADDGDPRILVGSGTYSDPIILN